jgi:hypothetical protein
LPTLQSIVDSLKGGGNPKDVAKKFNALATDAHKQKALETALQSCGAKGLTGSHYWSCVSETFLVELQKSPRLDSAVPLNAQETF